MLLMTTMAALKECLRAKSKVNQQEKNFLKKYAISGKVNVLNVKVFMFTKTI